MSIVSSLNLFRKLSGAADWNITGASHADEVCYLFRLSDIDYGQLAFPDSEEAIAVNLLTSTWTHFATYGKPMHRLQPLSPNHIHYVNFTNDGPVLSENPLRKRIDFWNMFFVKYFNMRI